MQNGHVASDPPSASFEKTVSKMIPEVYSDLRRIAADKIGRERAGQTLQATALVHEAFMRLARSGDDRKWKNDRHFISAAAESMRRILIENARAKSSRKRGGNPYLTQLEESKIIDTIPSDEILSVNEALDKFTEVDPEAAELVKLRYFVGLTIEEAADALNISRRTADRRWCFARAWLYRELNGSG